MIDAEDRTPIAVGIDIGTSGTRAVALNSQGDVTATAASAFATADENRNPLAWWAGARTCLEQLGGLCDLRAVEGIAVDGTSGTLLAVDRQYRPIGHASLYNDTCGDTSILQAVEDLAPAESPSRGAISPAARAIMLSRTQGTYKILHQADWVAFQLAHRSAAVSDENNALKTGYDLQNECWPEWLEKAGLDLELLPEVLRAGVAHAFVGARAVGLGFSDQCRVHAGTTDGCASFLATGAGEVGDGVTALGSTLVLKLASDCAISAPQYGIYSHRIGDIWLVGGASNTGGGVIRALFGDERLVALSRQLDPSRPTGLDYYPLFKPGERFPVSDPAYPPRLEPRPDRDALFFQGVLEGIAAIETLGYQRLAELGAPKPKTVRTVGGGAQNQGWTEIRQRMLNVAFAASSSTEAAAGTARLVLQGRQAND